MIIEQSMRGSGLFAGIGDDELAALLHCLGCRKVEFSRGDIIAYAGQPQKYVGLVLDGKVSLAKESASGQRMLIASLSTKDSFGEMNAFSGSRTWPVTISADSCGSILAVPIDRINSSCEKKCFSHWSLMTNLLTLVSQKALMLSRAIDYMGVKGIRRKLAVLLIEEAKKAGSLRFKMPMSRSQMADHFYVTRPALSNELRRLRDDGMVEFIGDRFRLIDAEKLQRIADGDV